MRPTVFLGHDDEQGKAWSARDRELAKALILHEGSQCPDCGQPTHEAYDPDRLGWYDVEPVVCTACFARDKAASEHDHGPGTRFRVTLDPNYVKRT